MSTVRLSTTSYVVLGLIGLRGRSTSYDLERAVQQSVGYFWPFPHAQFYAEPARLAQAGLLRVEQEETGRRRKIYTLTDRGDDELRAWLRQPVHEPFQIRNVAELKLFFGELADPADLVTLAQDQVRFHEDRLRELEAIEERFGNRADRLQRLVPLALGLRLEKAALEFWRERLCAPPPEP